MSPHPDSRNVLHSPCNKVHYKDEVFLQYFGYMCTIHGCMDIPEENLYIVEIIDVCEMTRQTAAEGVNGKVEVRLSGKPGIAMLAVNDENFN